MKIYEVVTGIIKKEDKVLVLRHNKCKGLCLFPCGKIEQGEEKFGALFRELFEEIGIEVTSATPLKSYRKWYDRVDGIMHVNEHVYYITNYNGIPFNKEPNKHLEMKWVKIIDILNNPKDYTTLTYELAVDLNDINYNN